MKTSISILLLIIMTAATEIRGQSLRILFVADGAPVSGIESKYSIPALPGLALLQINPQRQGETRTTDVFGAAREFEPSLSTRLSSGGVIPCSSFWQRRYEVIQGQEGKFRFVYDRPSVMQNHEDLAAQLRVEHTYKVQGEDECSPRISLTF